MNADGRVPPAPTGLADGLRTLSEYSIGLGEAARRAGVTRHTVRNWIVRGVTRGGKVIRLGAIPIGGRWRTSSADLAEFLAALAGAAFPAAPAVRGRTPRQARRDHERACEELRRAGILPR